jgi:hydrogenase-4 component E
MEHFIFTIILALQAAIFLAALLMHLMKNNSGLVTTYVLQSAFVAMILLAVYYTEGSLVLLLLALATIVIKCFLVPIVLSRLIKKHGLTFASSSYLPTFVVLLATLFVVIFVYSSLAPLFAGIMTESGDLLFLLLSSLFVSLLLAINHKEALSQIVGILSMENSIVALALALNVHVGLWLELGILGDIFAWLLIGTTFVSVVSKHFGSTDVTSMRHLSE